MNVFVKIVNEHLVYAPDKKEVNGTWFIGSAYTDEMKKADGYKMFADSPMPEYKEGFEIKEVLTEKEKWIERTWEYRELPIPEPTDFDKMKSVMDFNIDMGILIDPAE